MKKNKTNKSKKSGKDSMSFYTSNNVKNRRKKRTDIKYDLSICLITKNEEKYIERCLKSLSRLKEEISCEIIVTDTGSTDKTVEIVEKYADKVLHFEWCNDFSAARNTGVDASSGAWFMFVDADEIFDESVMNIAKFIKSNNRDSYDGATTSIKDYEQFIKSNDCECSVLSRLYNFTLEKRYFVNKIHENIPVDNSNMFNTGAIAIHYGYIGEVMEFKNARNLSLLREEFNEVKNDMRLIMNLIPLLPNEEKIEMFNYAIGLFDQNNDSNKIPILNARNITTIYLMGCFVYKLENDLEKLIECSDNYFNKPYMKRYLTENSSVTREIYFVLASSYYDVGNYELALINFVKYRNIYKLIEKLPDNIYLKYYNFKFGRIKFYNMAVLLELKCYDKINDDNNIIKLLIEEEIDDFDSNINTSDYVYFVIKYNQKNIAFKMIQNLTKKEDFFSCNDSYLYFALSLFVLGDIDDYLNACSLNDLYLLINKFFYSNQLYKYDALYNVLKNGNTYTSLKGTKLILKLMEVYIFNYYRVAENMVDDESLELVKLKTNEIFELYIECMYNYVISVYNEKILNDNQIDLLEPKEVLSYIIYPYQKCKNENQLEYIKALKKGLLFCNDFSDLVSNSLYFIEKSNTNVPKDNISEFDQLSEKIKLTIISAVKENEIQKAMFIFEEYKKINPNDPYLKEIEKLII